MAQAQYTKHLVANQREPQGNTVRNNAGGQSFALDKWSRLNQFLILGTEGGTYYVSERKLTRTNVESLAECLNDDFIRTIDRIAEVSDKGLAPKNDPAIFALAYAASHKDEAVRAYALSKLNVVCRIGTHILHFVSYVDDMRGWGRALKRNVANWYLSKSPNDLAYQLVKYKQRDGWAHRDVLRLAKPKNVSGPRMKSALAYATNGQWATDEYPDIFYSEHMLKESPTLKTLHLVGNVPREILPTEMLNDPEVWKRLLDMGMPLTAMVRNLGKMTSVGVFNSNLHIGLVRSALIDPLFIKRSRLHPLALLVAARVYGSGHGMKGSLSWNPHPKIMAALDKAFYLAFDNVEPTGQNIMIGLDVSGSMGSGGVAGSPLTPCEAAAAMCLVTERVEDNSSIMAFAEKFMPLAIGSHMSLSEVVNKTSRLRFGGTDCAVPMLHAMNNKLDVDAFIVYTDSETWAGAVHPYVALEQYRKKMNKPNAKLIVVGMVSNGFSIANPDDPGMLDVVGFDASAPAIISNFIKGL